MMNETFLFVFMLAAHNLYHHHLPSPLEISTQCHVIISFHLQLNVFAVDWMASNRFRIEQTS